MVLHCGFEGKQPPPLGVLDSQRKPKRGWTRFGHLLWPLGGFRFPCDVQVRSSERTQLGKKSVVSASGFALDKDMARWINMSSGPGRGEKGNAGGVFYTKTRKSQVYPCPGMCVAHLDPPVVPFYQLFWGRVPLLKHRKKWRRKKTKNEYH